jgi:hypothetical protein
MAGGSKGGSSGASASGGGDTFSGTDLAGPFPGSNTGDLFSSMDQSGGWGGPGGGGNWSAPDMVVGTQNDPVLQAQNVTSGGAMQAAASGPQGPGAGTPGAGQQSGPGVPPIADLLGIGDELKGLSMRASPREAAAAAAGTGGAGDPGWFRASNQGGFTTDPRGQPATDQWGNRLPYATPMNPIPHYPQLPQPSPSAPAPQPAPPPLPRPDPRRGGEPTVASDDAGDTFPLGRVDAPNVEQPTFAELAHGGATGSWDQPFSPDFPGRTALNPPGTDSPTAGNAAVTIPSIGDLLRSQAPGSLASIAAQAAAQAGTAAPGGSYGGGPQPGAAEPNPAQTISPATTQAATPPAATPDARLPGQAGYQGAPAVAGQPPAEQGAQPPASTRTAPPGGQQGINPIQAIIDLFTKGPGAFMQDLAGVARQAQPSGDWMPGYGPSTGHYQRDPAIDQQYGNRIDPTTGRPVSGTPPAPPQGAPRKTPAEDEQQQAAQRRQDLGQGGTYILNDQGQRVRVQTNPDGSVKTDAQGNPIPAAPAQGTQAAPGAAVPRGSYPALNTRITTAHPVSLGPVNAGLQDTLAAGAQQFENNNPGYKVQVNSGHRGGNDPHGRNNAVDLQIIGPQGPIANAGADSTGKYTELARSILGAQRALHPELNGRLAWGGYFNADGAHGFADPRSGANRPDLMHFDLEGNMPWRTAMRERYYGLGATGNYGQGQAQRGASREPPQPLPPGQSRPPADVGGALRAANGRPTQAMSDYIQDRARAYNIDPNVALRVAKSEGFNQFSSGIRGENSYGAFQLNTQGGLGNEFQKQTGLDPRDPKNERAAIDWSLKYAAQHGWGPWHGAAKTGIGRWQGINRGAARPAPPAPAPAPIQAGSQRADINPAANPADEGHPGAQFRRDVKQYLRNQKLQAPGPGPGEPGLVYPPGWPIDDPTGAGRRVVVSDNLASRYGLDWV